MQRSRFLDISDATVLPPLVSKTSCAKLCIAAGFLLVSCSCEVIATLGVADIDSRLEEQIIDGIVYAFQDPPSCKWIWKVDRNWIYPYPRSSCDHKWARLRFGRSEILESGSEKKLCTLLRSNL